MKRNIFYVIIIAVLLVTTIFYRYRSRELSYRLTLIHKRIEESKRTKAGKEPIKPKVAIVLDDFGYNLSNLEKVWELEIPITLSILPNLPYSKKIAKAAERRGIEVMLHLPMEPYENMRLEENTIMTSMTDEEILKNLEEAITSVPNLRGISNHMGSKATEDERVISLIFKRMKDDDLYFLDNVVTNKSVCRSLSRRMGIAFTSRSVFLDNLSDAEYIKENVKELLRQAIDTDWAIGVGHDRALTLEVIKEIEPELNSMGVDIVPISEIAE